MAAPVTGPDYSIFYLFAFYVAFKLWNRAGGWPEAYYRLVGMAYHQFYILDKNIKVQRPIIPDKKLNTEGGIARFGWPKKNPGEYLLGTNKERFSNPHGAPSFLYRWDDSRPLGINAESTDEARKLARMDPMLVRSGFHNKNLAELNDLAKATHAKRDGLILLLILCAALFSMLGAWYEYNTTCALHTLACPGGTAHP